MFKYFVLLLIGMVVLNANAFITYPTVDPVAFHIVNFPVHWYGLFYLFGLGIVYLASTNYIKYYHLNNRYQAITGNMISDALLNGFILAIIGGRLFYVIFYMSYSEWIDNPIKIVAIWQGGMSFHGGLVGAIIGIWYTSHTSKVSLLGMLDQIAPWASFAIALGRVANFINDELWGRVTDVPWAVLFPSGGFEPRHPSQLYQAGLEGITVAVILIILTRRNLPAGILSGIGLIVFAISRIIVEFFRMPDSQLGYYFGYFTMGQFLSLPMIFVGGVIIWMSKQSIRK